ncbi:hypothetical protein AsAng_0039550 [Aureispira anguillae]|uniref:Uncharacterized protein n=1 Tax=Aureispira anguillae TaxID=2864201 RepID=A0A916DVK8_9BACT|nr:hypothetical protein AsAng_0039550 [Aureispira anguillae]
MDILFTLNQSFSSNNKKASTFLIRDVLLFISKKTAYELSHLIRKLNDQ